MHRNNLVAKAYLGGAHARCLNLDVSMLPGHLKHPHALDLLLLSSVLHLHGDPAIVYGPAEIIIKFSMILVHLEIFSIHGSWH